MIRRLRGNLWLVTVLTAASIAVLAACATMDTQVRHGFFMRGMILEKYDSQVYLCIGKKDGATVGQELDVIKIITSGGHPSTGLTFKREITGKVRITEIIDEHFAKAVVISGTADKNSIVELAP